MPSIVRIALSLFGFSLWYLDPCVVPVPLKLLHYGSCEMYETAAAVHLLPAVCERVWPHLCVCGPHCGLGCDFALPFGGLDWSPALNVSSGAAVDVAAKQLHISLPRSISSWLQKERTARKGARRSVGLVCETVSLLFFSFTTGLHL